MDALGIELVGDHSAAGKGRVLAQLVEPSAQLVCLPLGSDEEGKAAAAGTSEEPALG